MPYKFNLQLFSEEAAPAHDSGTADKASFDELIGGDYRDDFNQKVNSIIAKRFKSEKSAEERLGKLTSSLHPAMESLGAESPEELAEKLAEKADADGILQNRLAAAESRSVEEKCTSWLCAAAELEQEYPDFDLSRELENETFKNGLRLGIDLKTFYSALHLDEVKNALSRQAALSAEERLLQRQSRPTECGAGAVGAVRSVTDVEALTDEEMEKIVARISKGDKISFS